MQKILRDTIDDLAQDFLIYDRKEDEELERGDIEKMIAKGETNLDEIVEAFRESCAERLG